MDKYISLEAALAFNIPVDDLNISTPDEWIIGDRFAEFLKSIPAADVRPVVHAHWERTETDLGTCCICSSCGSCPSMEYKFCPYCGADMKEVKNAEIHQS